MCRDRCPRCDYYSCSCSSDDLRRYQDYHRFDNPFGGSVLRRWEQDEANERVTCELRDRERKEREEQEAREQEARAERRRKEERRQTEEEYYANQEEMARREAEDAEQEGGQA